MEKIVQPKVLLGILIVTLCLSFMSMCSSGSAKSESRKVKKEMVQMQSEIDSLTAITIDKSELKTLFEIEGLKTSKRTLYDWNAVIRTTVRPDDQMKSYDDQIKALEKTLPE